jgi:hypothetical protein
MRAYLDNNILVSIEDNEINYDNIFIDYMDNNYEI